jgi:hypothetical protein
MSVYSPEYHAMVISPGPGPTEAVTVTANQPAEQHESFFHHMLDVVNPLQHLPVIGTIYRAITGEHLDPVERIAGDTLYGGLWGAVSSVADVAFESITGKSFEDTAMALLRGDGTPKVTSAKVVAPSITADLSLPSSDLPALPSTNTVAANTPNGLDIAALTSALSAKGVDGATANRALYAYRRSMGLNATLPVLASVH